MRTLTHRNMLARLEALSIPPAALVIDLHAIPDDVLETLRIEIENLASEMDMRDVPHWRYLTDFLYFKKLPPLKLAEIETLVSSAKKHLQRRTLSGRSQQGPSRHIGEYYIDDEEEELSFLDSLSNDELKHNIEESMMEINAVRNKRLEAAGDVGKRGSVGPHALDPKVQVIFLTDAGKPDTLSSAAAYAALLKHEYGILEKDGQLVLDTMVICLNHDNRGTPPKKLLNRLRWPYFDSLDRKGDEWQHINSLVLSERFGANAVNIPKGMQPQIAELLLYVLLISQPLEVRPPAPDPTQLFLPPPGTKETRSLPPQTYVVGLSAVEYSARWGRLLLNYDLATEAIEVLQDTSIVDQAKTARDVETWLSDWRDLVRSAVHDKITGDVPALQAFSHAESVAKPAKQVFASPRLNLDKTTEAIKEYTYAIAQTYTMSIEEREAARKAAQEKEGTQNVTLPPTLEDALGSIPQIQQKVSSWQDSNQETPLSEALTKACGVLSDQRFFMGAQGSVSRARIQLKQLSKTIAAFQNKHKQNAMDLKERREVLEKMSQQKTEDLKKYLGRFPWWLGRLARERARIIEEICAYQQETSQAVLRYIADTIALDLLKRAQLTDGNGGEGEYYRRIEQLSPKLDKIHDYTSKKSQLATQRLMGRLNEKIGAGIMAKKVPTLRIREELLDMETLMLKDKKLSDSLANKREELEGFAEILLRAIGEEIPATIDREMRARPFVAQQIGELSYQESREQHEAQLLMSASVAVALRMVVAMPDKDVVTPLWERYDELDYRITDEYSSLKSLLETMKKQVTAHARIQNNRVVAMAAPATPTITEDDTLALAGYSLAQWGQMLWEYRDKELHTMLTCNGIIHYLQQEGYDPQTVRSLLATRTVVTGSSSRVGQRGELYILMFPSVEGQQYFQEMHLEPHFREIPDTERLLLLYISPYIAPPQYVVDDTLPADQVDGDAANRHQVQVPPEKDDNIVDAKAEEIKEETPPPPDASFDPQLARNFQRYEKHLVGGIAAEPDPSAAIGDPDLDLPIRARLAQIQADKEALELFVDKNLKKCHKFANPTGSKDAFFLAQHSFAVRAGQRALGIPEEKLLSWSLPMQQLLAQVKDAGLQRLVREDMVLTPSIIGGPPSAPPAVTTEVAMKKCENCLTEYDATLPECPKCIVKPEEE